MHSRKGKKLLYRSKDPELISGKEVDTNTNFSMPKPQKKCTKKGIEDSLCYARISMHQRYMGGGVACDGVLEYRIEWIC